MPPVGGRPPVGGKQEDSNTQEEKVGPDEYLFEFIKDGPSLFHMIGKPWRSQDQSLH